MSDPRQDASDFEDYCKLWDKACENDLFKDVPTTQPRTTSFLGLGTSGSGQSQEDIFMDADLIQERAGDPYFDYMKMLLETDQAANPVYPDSIGKDQDAPKPAWLDQKAMEAVEKLKKELYEIECKLNTEDAGGKKWVEKCHHPKDQKMWSQLESLRKKIDNLSDNLGLKNEPDQSMRNVKD